VAGEGGDRKNIESTIEKRNMSSRVKILGRVSDETRNILFKTCDIFVQPNIKIPGTIEGFGISVIEAGASGIIVLASKLEGLQDAIQDGQNGFLVDSGNAEKWIQKIEAIFSAGDDFRKQFGLRASQFVKDNYSWDKIAGRYLEELQKVIK
jgi:glycosyltransferase involved in cell wall biosynthesis